MHTNRKKVLMITYYFPPSGGSGVQRTLKFVKYLRDFGWEPIVLTVVNADYPAYDESLWTDVPTGIQIYRSKIFEPYRLYRKFTSKKKDESTDIATLSLDEQAKQNLNEKISEWIRAAFFIPDARICWMPFAFYLGVKILRKEKINVIYSSAPPYTTHLIGMMLHRFSNIPWIADFRDSWIGWLSTPQWRPGWSRVLDFWMEDSVLRHANRLLTVSKGVKEDLLSRHPQYRIKNWHFLPNGFDEDDFKERKHKSTHNKLTFIYTGSLYGNRNPEHLLRALERMQLEHSDVTKKIHFLLVGRIAESILQRIRTSSVSDLFDCLDYVKHSESIRYLMESDVSLLIIDDAPVNRGILTGKLFEYIGVGHPIFALAPEGDAAELIRSYRFGEVVPPKDTRKIYDTILKLLHDYDDKKMDFNVSHSIRKKFERRALTEDLAEILNCTT